MRQYLAATVISAVVAILIFVLMDDLWTSLDLHLPF
jgi:predicted secreted protein